MDNPTTPLIKRVIENTRQISLSTTMLNQLMDFERVLDSVNLYVFDNWINGELVEGPVVKKYWTTCKFMWPLHKMPDPRGGKKLLNYGCRVTYEKSKLEHPVKVESYDNFESGTKYPKMKLRPIWIVEIAMPKSLMGEIKRGSLDVEGEDIDLSDVEKAYENDLDDQSNEIAGMEGNAAPAGPPGAPLLAPGAPPQPAPPVA